MNKNSTIAIAIIATATMYGLYLIIPALMNTYNSYNELESAKTQVAQTQQQIDDIKKAKQEHERIEKVATRPIYKNEAPSDDAMSSFGVMFEDVIQAAKYNKLKLFSIAYNMAPAEDIIYKNISSDFNVCEISMQLIGSYADFKSYFQDIYNYPYLINLSKIEIKPYERDKSILIGDIKVILYSKKV